MNNKKFEIQMYGDNYYIVLSENNIKDEYTSIFDIKKEIGIDEEMLFDKIKEYEPIISEVDKVAFTSLNNSSRVFNVKMLSFADYNYAKKVVEILEFEKQISKIKSKIYEINQKYFSKKDFTRENIQSMFLDRYINDIWEIEKSRSNKFNTFEDFLIFYIEQEFIFEN